MSAFIFQEVIVAVGIVRTSGIDQQFWRNID